jgi:hypothetical protein
VVAAEVPLAKPAVSDDTLGDRLALLERAPELLDHDGGGVWCCVVVGGRDRERLRYRRGLVAEKVLSSDWASWWCVDRGREGKREEQRKARQDYKEQIEHARWRWRCRRMPGQQGTHVVL